ncbi:MAG: hypothetical protein NW220_18025 [Leptolyngbyaceae cyanobacterium bins.349]|nr:hypothetical protein [Leptolyngbyaceae cyanobacterium bins.349]
MANCPFCSDILLRHIRAGQSYWLCRRCRTEILEEESHQANPANSDRKPQIIEEASPQAKLNHSSAKIELNSFA